MFNVFVANYRKGSSSSAKQHPKDSLLRDLRNQIDNSLRLGWSKEKIIVVTNFTFCHNNVGSLHLEINKDCLTGSKMFAMRELFRLGMVTEDVWIHDLDAWQNSKFIAPEFADVGMAEYSKPKYNGGSMFYSPKSQDIVETICGYIENNREVREEPTLDKFLRNEFKDRTTTVNSTYNLGCSGYVPRYERSIKPVQVLHFHPTNRIAWDTHTRDRNGVGESGISEGLKAFFIERYGSTIEKYKYEDGDERSPFELRTKKVDREKAAKMGIS